MLLRTPPITFISVIDHSSCVYIRWHGFSCFEFADDTVRVVVDPHDGKSIGVYPPSASANVVLCTCNNYTRNAFRVIKGDHKDFTCIVGKCEANGFSFEGLPSVGGSDPREDAWESVIYMFQMDGISVACCGPMCDVPSKDVVERLKGADIIFVPVGEYGTIRIHNLNCLLDEIGVRVVVPTCYRVGGVTLPVLPVSDFMEGKDTDDFVHVGNEVELTSEDISDFRGYWIFDR